MYLLKHIDGVDSYVLKNGNSEGIPFKLDDVIELAHQNKARADGTFNYQKIYPAIMGMVPFVAAVTPWEQDDAGVQEFANNLQKSTFEITGECIPTMPFYNMDKVANKRVKKVYGSRPSLTMVHNGTMFYNAIDAFSADTDNLFLLTENFSKTLMDLGLEERTEMLASKKKISCKKICPYDITSVVL